MFEVQWAHSTSFDWQIRLLYGTHEPIKSFYMEKSFNKSMYSLAKTIENKKTEHCLFLQIFVYLCTLLLPACFIPFCAPASCFNVLNGEKRCGTCGMLRIVFRNVRAPDLGDKLNYLQMQERKPILPLLWQSRLSHGKILTDQGRDFQLRVSHKTHFGLDA